MDNKKRKTIFLDRDGVINEVNIDEEGKHHSPLKLKEFRIREGVKEFVGIVKDRGYLVIVATNKPEVKRGLMTREEVEKMHDVVGAELEVDDIFACFHTDEDECSCRKPAPGMLLSAADKWNIDLEKSWMIGDTYKDAEAGKAAGCRTAIVDAPYNKDAQSDLRIESVLDLLEVLD